MQRRKQHPITWRHSSLALRGGSCLPGHKDKAVPSVLCMALEYLQTLSIVTGRSTAPCYRQKGGLGQSRDTLSTSLGNLGKLLHKSYCFLMLSKQIPRKGNKMLYFKQRRHKALGCFIISPHLSLSFLSPDSPSLWIS